MKIKCPYCKEYYHSDILLSMHLQDEHDGNTKLAKLLFKIHTKIEKLEDKIKINPYDDTHALPELQSLLEDEK